MIGEILMQLNSEVYQRALAIKEAHSPVGPEGWTKCGTCNQSVESLVDTFPIWPCDARRLADLVVRLMQSKTRFQMNAEEKKRRYRDRA